MKITEISQLAKRITDNVERVIVGKEETLELMVSALVAGGHVLLDDVPGTGKTVMAKSLAKSIDSSFSRIQFTPDLLPTDVTGLSVFDQKTCEFRFSPGPVFTNILLADEINRATPRTQSALLECMEERQVTIDGVTRGLSSPFFVIATENPVEQSGTYNLPEAQLDRFLMRLTPGYPDEDGSIAILRRFIRSSPLEELEPVASAAEVVEAQEGCKAVHVSEKVMKYIVELAAATRTLEEVSLGVSPRGMLSMMRACQALAAVRGRDYVLPDDVKELCVPVFAHRMVVRNSYGSARKAAELLNSLTASLTVPTEDGDGTIGR